MAYTTIDDPSAHFTVKTYTGTGSTNAITNDANAGNFKPDWLWIKQRNTARSHRLITSSFFSTYLQSNLTNAEASNDVVNSLDTDGFTLSTPASVNQSSGTYVAWQWKANGGTTTTNDASATGVGTIDSVYQANTTAGFSIVTYTGTTSAGTIAHGLGAVPKMIIIKNRDDGAENWAVYHAGIASDAETDYIYLDSNNAAADDANLFNDTAPTSTVFSIGTSGVVNQAEAHVAYCFAEIKGYSKFGSYTANGNVDGPFVYTGFKPAWVMFKQSNDSDTAHWFMYDSTRSPTNVIGDDGFAANLSTEEGLGSTWNPNTSDSVVDFVSNGFKIRTTATSGFNINGNTMIYMAFAEHPFVSSKGVPVTAR